MSSATQSAGQRDVVIVGQASSAHDGAVAILIDDEVYAEAFERPTQLKFAMRVLRHDYTWRAIRNALKRLGKFPVCDADLVFRTTWEHERTDVGGADSVFSDGFPVTKAVFRAHLRGIQNELMWIVGADHPPVFTDQPPDQLPWPKPRGLRIEHHGLRHHLCHAALAVYTSGFEECQVLINDGGGEVEGISYYHFHDNQFDFLGQTAYWSGGVTSLGVLYSFVTLLCGFNCNEGEEWKVMGLAAYGKLRPDLYAYFRERTAVKGLDVELRFDLGSLYRDVGELTGGLRAPGDADVLRAADLAHTFQKFYTDVLLEVTANFSALGLSKNLAYAGGCALNCDANGKIVGRTGFERVHVPSAPADDGTALGAALYEKHCVRRAPRSPGTFSPYLGSELDIGLLEKILGFGGIQYRRFETHDELCGEVARLLAAGKIIGWAQGRAEFGPRALGNRSIIADPRPADMRDRINRLVKFREQYRPLAPSILHEYGPEYFEDYQESPYMDRTLVFKESVRGRVPAVVHVDNTGRLQSVKQEWNPLYYRLISEFHQLTGIPLVLNTSFNVMGKPIIHSIEDALTTFYTSGMEQLAIDRYLMWK